MRVTQVYFSPGNTTQAVIEHFSAAFSGEAPRSLDLLREDPRRELRVAPDELLAVNLPVFAGRVPRVCPDRLAALKGEGGPAVALVTYGNRDYDDALKELCHLLAQNGFRVIAAGAFVARHSIFPAVAAGRPDSADLKRIEDFALACRDKLRGETPDPDRLALDYLARLKGEVPGGDYAPRRMFPSGDATCINCGVCVRLCPVRAIPAENPTWTDPERCFGCTACIWNCPAKSRAFRGDDFNEGGRQFAAAFSARKEPETFL